MWVKKLLPRQQTIIDLIKSNPTISMMEMSVALNVSSHRTAVDVLHFRPGKGQRLRLIIESFEPELWQLKHFHEGRVDGGKEVAPFSAYSKRDDKYAKSLLRQAYEDYDGDVDDRTYLYTYDAKYKTFVEFRPDRGNKYHGRDIDIEYAKRKAPDIVRRYNQ